MFSWRWKWVHELLEDFVFVSLVSLKSNINLKMNDGLDKFWKGLISYLHRAMGNLDVKELTAGIMKSSINMEHPPGTVVNVIGE